QPTPAFAVKKIQLLRGDAGAGGAFNIEVPADRPIAEGATSPGTQTATYLVKIKVATNSLWKVRMLARPGLDVTGPALTGTGAQADATGDAGPAGAVGSFTATWEAANVTFKWKRPVTNANSIQNYNVWITEQAANPAFFMQVLSDGTTRAGQLATTQS